MNPMHPMNLTNFEAMAKAHQEQIDRRIAKIHEMQKERKTWSDIEYVIKNKPHIATLQIVQIICNSLGKDFLKKLVLDEAPNRVANIDQAIESEINDLRMMIVRK